MNTEFSINPFDLESFRQYLERNKDLFLDDVEKMISGSINSISAIQALELRIVKIEGILRTNFPEEFED